MRVLVYPSDEYIGQNVVKHFQVPLLFCAYLGLGQGMQHRGCVLHPCCNVLSTIPAAGGRRRCGGVCKEPCSTPQGRPNKNNTIWDVE